MQRRRFMITAGAVLAFGMALAAQRTATQADRTEIVTERSKPRWQPGSVMPMSAFDSDDRIVPPPPR